MNQMFRRLFFVLALVSIFTFVFFHKLSFVKKLYPNLGKEPLITFYDSDLYEEEVESLNIEEREKYINNWIIIRFLEKEIEKQIDEFTTKEIERKVSFYKSKLLTHIYLEKLIDEKIDISSEEIEKYYKNNANSFLLKEPIFRGILVIVPKNLQETITIKNLLESPIKNLEELKKHCFHVAKKYNFNDNEWQFWQEALVGTPYINRNINTKSFLKNKLYVEHDKTYAYYLWITDIKYYGEIAPISLVEDAIKQKIQIIKKLEIEKTVLKNILSKAKNDSHFKENKS